jgi:ArsR family transcriptional regulator
MDLVSIYQCLCDRTRLRILNALSGGPLCVRHLQEILDEPQVKISKHLGYLRRNRMVESVRQANCVFYRLPAKRPHELSANLGCLQDCVREDPSFKRDEKRAVSLRAKLGSAEPFQAC